MSIMLAKQLMSFIVGCKKKGYQLQFDKNTQSANINYSKKYIKILT